MRNSKLVFSTLAVASLFSMQVFAAEKAVDKTTGTDNLEDLKFYDSVQTIVTGDKAADKIFSSYHKNYIKFKNNINKEMDKYLVANIKAIDSEKKEGLKVVENTQKLFDKNCLDKETLKEQKNFDQCQTIKENIFNINEKIKNLDVETKNQKEKSHIDRINRLKKNYIDYKNISAKLKAAVDNNHQ